MNTKFLLSSCAGFLGMMGVALLFVPEELILVLGIEGSNELIFQLMGGLYFGFAMLNWMSKGNAIGGIYGRPIAIGNFTHFFIGSIILVKVISLKNSELGLIIVGLCYLVFTAAFAYLLFSSKATPISK